MSFDAYGDESAGANFVAYGTLLLPAASREAVEAKIAKLKIDYGASAADNLHCRVLSVEMREEKLHGRSWRLATFLTSIRTSWHLLSRALPGRS